MSSMRLLDLSSYIRDIHYLVSVAQNATTIVFTATTQENYKLTDKY